MTRRALNCLDCDRPWVISGRCREHHYKLRGWPWPDTQPLVSMSAKWMRKRIEKARIERVNAELNEQPRA